MKEWRSRKATPLFLGLLGGEHTNKVINNVNLLGAVAAGLVRGVYVDTLNKLINNSRGKRVNLAVLLHQGDKLGHVHGLGLSLVQFSMEGLGLFG